MNDGISFEEACTIDGALTEAQKANCPGIESNDWMVYILIGLVLATIIIGLYFIILKRRNNS